MNWDREEFERDKVRYEAELADFLARGFVEGHPLVERARRRVETVTRVLTDPAYGLAPPEPCQAETHSWEHFTQDQVDSYWITCTLTGPHDEHRDANTGLTWKTAQG